VAPPNPMPAKRIERLKAAQNPKCHAGKPKRPRMIVVCAPAILPREDSENLIASTLAKASNCTFPKFN
jgi:hypothetical protein